MTPSEKLLLLEAMTISDKLLEAERNTTRWALGNFVWFNDPTGYFRYKDPRLMVSKHSLTRKCMICGCPAKLLFCKKTDCLNRASRYLDIILHEPDLTAAEEKKQNQQYIPCENCGTYNFKRKYCGELCYIQFKDKSKMDTLYPQPKD